VSVDNALELTTPARVLHLATKIRKKSVNFSHLSNIRASKCWNYVRVLLKHTQSEELHIKTGKASYIYIAMNNWYEAVLLSRWML